MFKPARKSGIIDGQGITSQIEGVRSEKGMWKHSPFYLPIMRTLYFMFYLSSLNHPSNNLSPVN